MLSLKYVVNNEIPGGEICLIKRGLLISFGISTQFPSHLYIILLC